MANDSGYYHKKRVKERIKAYVFPERTLCRKIICRNFDICLRNKVTAKNGPQSRVPPLSEKKSCRLPKKETTRVELGGFGGR
jgi:hypothetical protein